MPTHEEAYKAIKCAAPGWALGSEAVDALKGLGEIVPGETPIRDSGYAVARGRIATVEVGVEVKILAKAMIKQIDRVINDLRNQEGICTASELALGFCCNW